MKCSECVRIGARKRRLPDYQSLVDEAADAVAVFNGQSLCVDHLGTAMDKQFAGG